MIFALVSDLMDRSKFGDSVQCVSSVGQLPTEGLDTLVVDLDSYSIDPAELNVNNVIGYCSHVNAEARAAVGFSQILTRSELFADVQTALSLGCDD